MTPQEARRRIKVVQDFMNDIQKVTKVVPRPLKSAVDKLLAAIDAGLDVVEAADEVSREIRLMYEDNYKACRDAYPHQLDDYWACRARIDRQWQKIATSKVLYWNDDRSVVRRVWDKWKEKLAKWLEGSARSTVKSRW